MRIHTLVGASSINAHSPQLIYLYFTVSRQALERRLTRLEKRLKIPESECHICAGKLAKAEDTIVFGTRIRDQKTDAGASTRVPVAVQVQGPTAVYEYKALLKKWRLDEPEDKWVGKSAWEGRNMEKVTVEELALQHYENQGFKG
jgi:Fanconi-associated nuclease 1